MPISKPLVLSKMVVGVAICVSSVPATANPCVAGAQGCVLPLRDALVQQSVYEAPVAVAPVVEPVILEERRASRSSPSSAWRLPPPRPTCCWTMTTKSLI